MPMEGPCFTLRGLPDVDDRAGSQCPLVLGEVRQRVGYRRSGHPVGSLPKEGADCEQVGSGGRRG